MTSGVGIVNLWSPEHVIQESGESFVKACSSTSNPPTFPVFFKVVISILWKLCLEDNFFSPHLQMVFFGYMVFSILFGLLADRYGQIGWLWTDRLALKDDLEFSFVCSFVVTSSLLFFRGHFSVNTQVRKYGNILLWHHMPEFQEDACLPAFSSFPEIPVPIPGPHSPGVQLTDEPS